MNTKSELIELSEPLRTKIIANIRCIIAEMVEQAQSGHSGSAMSLTPLFLELNMLKSPEDIILLSAAHACPVVYAFAHFLYDLELKQLKLFRQLHSKTPGHAERCPEIGVILTSEPLGQGIGQSVGLALASKLKNEDKNVFCKHIVVEFQESTTSFYSKCR